MEKDKEQNENRILIILMAITIAAANIWYWGFSERQNNAGPQPETELTETAEEKQETQPAQEEPVKEETTQEEEAQAAYVPYQEYTPEETNSYFYEDAGLIPGTMVADYVTVDDSYFADACFIGDSRCTGIYDYSPWKDADYFCDSGFCAYDYSNEKAVKKQSTGEKITLDTAMQQRQYSKIYIMLGVNDCGYGNDEMFTENYGSMLSMIQTYQPDATIYLLGNLHVSRNAEENSVEFKNKNINAKNVIISKFADGQKIIYLDFNELFVDEEGYLKDEFTFDGFHLYADGYIEVLDYLREHVIGGNSIG